MFLSQQLSDFSLIGWGAMVFDIVDHGNEVMMAHFAFLSL